MYHLIPLCCICSKNNKTLKKIEDNEENTLHLLSDNNNFDKLTIELPLYICKNCSLQLQKIQQFQQQFNNSITKMLGYITKLSNNEDYYCEPKIILNPEPDLIIKKENLECQTSEQEETNEQLDIIQTINNRITTIIDQSLTNDALYKPKRKKTDNWYDSPNVLKSLLKAPPPSIHKKPVNQNQDESSDFVNNMRNNFKSILQKNDRNTLNSTAFVDDIRNKFNNIIQKQIEHDEIEIKTEEIEYMIIEPKQELFED